MQINKARMDLKTNFEAIKINKDSRHVKDILFNYEGLCLGGNYKSSVDNIGKNEPVDLENFIEKSKNIPSKIKERLLNKIQKDNPNKVIIATNEEAFSIKGDDNSMYKQGENIINNAIDILDEDLVGVTGHIRSLSIECINKFCQMLKFRNDFIEGKIK